MPGPHVTERQMRIYMNQRQSEPPAVAAARAGFSAATAYRVGSSDRRPRGAFTGQYTPSQGSGLHVPPADDSPCSQATQSVPPSPHAWQGSWPPRTSSAPHS